MAYKYRIQCKELIPKQMILNKNLNVDYRQVLFRKRIVYSKVFLKVLLLPRCDIQGIPLLRAIYL